MSEHRFTCADCGEEKVHVNPHDCGGTGYATVREGGIDKKVCDECCAKRDTADMTASGRAVLYLTVEGPVSTVSNWPGTLSLPVRSRHIGSHNIAGRREDVWFIGPDGQEWHGVCYGCNTQLCHCRRLKGKCAA